MKRVILLTYMALLLLISVAKGEVIYNYDPSDLHIGNPPNSGAYLFGDEVRPISNIALGILLNGHPNPTLLDSPLLLILGVPNQTSLPPSISSVLTGGTASGPTYMTSLDPGEEVYTILGRGDQTNNSNNFTNWHDADLAVNGINAAFFGIFVYDLYDTGIKSTSHNPVNVIFESDIPQGTFAIAYDTLTKIKNNDDIEITPFSTAFTESGLTTGEGFPIPEPSTIVLLGSGILGVALYGRRRFKK
jgi:hypothetical protein